MKFTATIRDKETKKELYHVDVEFPDDADTKSPMFAAAILEAERRILEETLEIKWQRE